MRQYIDISSDFVDNTSLMEGEDFLTEGSVQTISPQEAKDRKMFGPLYHGTPHNIDDILKTGFNSKYSVPSGIGNNGRPIGTTNGMSIDGGYGYSVPPPIHFLGFGSYFTTVKAIAKQFNGNTTKGLKTFYLDSQNVEEINFGSVNTMFKWWRQNGYDMQSKDRDVKAWIKATGNLTRTLRGQFDAVWYKGKSIRKLLDGDQVVVFRPSLIFVVDTKLASGFEIGSKVTHTGFIKLKGRNDLYVDDLHQTDFGNAGKLAGSGWRGIFRAADHDGKDIPRSGNKTPHGENIGNYPIHLIPPPGMVGVITDYHEVPEQFRERDGNKRYSVKWAKGGEMHNYLEQELQPYTKTK